MRATLLHQTGPDKKRAEHRVRWTHPTSRSAGRLTRRARLATCVVATVALLGVGGCGGSPTSSDRTATDASTAPTDDPRSSTVERGRVEPPPSRPGAPGEPIDVEAIDAPAGGRAVRFSYHSSGAGGADIAVTGVLLTPDRPPPVGGFPLITWAHPTTGAADGCQPSVEGTAALPYPDDLVAQGWAVVATDYEGLGSAGPHPYLVGASEGPAVLDAARAASRIDGSGVDASSPLVIWGFSQGGHAGAFAAELAPTYAPELDLVGVALAAPVSDVGGFTRRAEQMDDQLGVVLTIVNGFDAAYPELDPATVLTAEGVEALTDVERRCIGELNEDLTQPTDTIIAAPPTADDAFAARFAENRAGDHPITAPVLIVQGSEDDIVDPAASAALAQRYCDREVLVRYDVIDGTNHGVLAREPFLGWIRDRFDRAQAPTTC